MKLQGTPEEMKQAKNWWADQKKRIDEEYKETKKKDKNAKKDTSLVSPENKERTYRRHEVSFSQIKGDKSQKYLDNYLAKHSSQEDDWKKQLDDELTKKVIYRAIYRFEGNDREILLMFMRNITITFSESWRSQVNLLGNRDTLMQSVALRVASATQGGDKIQ